MRTCIHSRRIGSAWFGLLVTGFVLAVAAGCKTLPETGVTSFAGSTGTLAATVTTVGLSTVQDVANLHDGSDASKTEAARLSASLKTEWDKRVKLMSAMNRYAASLTGLVNAGKAGKENAQAFGEGLKGLIDAVGVVIPEDAAVKPILDGVALIYGKVAESIAAGEIQRAVEQADPAIAKLADLIAADLVSLRSVAASTHRTRVTKIKAGSDWGPTLQKYQRTRGSLTGEALGGGVAAVDQLTKLAALMTSLQNDADYKEYVAQLDAADRAFDTEVELLDQAALTTQAWATAHHEIVLALRQNRTASVQELTQFAQDLYDVYKEYRAARKAAAGAKKP